MLLHPGARVALARLSMNELDVARAMAAGELTSPQKYYNLYLYCLRITGTGYSYRSAVDEFVYRKPENYLTDDFLARCNGLFVIMRHPKKKPILDSAEFSDRIVGSVMLPYIRGDEVWCVAKIIDADCIKVLQEKQMSTSPAVLVPPGMKLRIDGDKLHVEDDPKLLDHIAICEHGVWDKGGEPSGVIQTDIMIGDSEMADKKEDGDKQPTMKEVMDSLGSMKGAIDACNARMDAMAKPRKDAEEPDPKKPVEVEDPDAAKAAELAADKAKGARKDGDPETLMDKGKGARKDGETEDKPKEEEKDKKEEEAHADSTATINALKAQIDALAKRVPRDITDDDYSEMAKLQARADEVIVELGNGKRAPRPFGGETAMGYRRRVAEMLKANSPTWRDKDLNGIADGAFEPIESMIYQDSFEAARNPSSVEAGQLRRVPKQVGPHTHIEYYGAPAAWMNELAGPLRNHVTKLYTPNNGSAR